MMSNIWRRWGRRWGGLASAALLASVALLAALPASGTTMRRAGLEALAQDHETVVLGEVQETFSYWSPDGSTILTDVTLVAAQTLKGEERSEVKVTVLGGTVAGRTLMVIGGPELRPGRSYLLFLNTENLPGAASVTTVRELSQGVFDIELKAGRLKAVSQASRHPLMPDFSGLTEPPGGRAGMALDTLISTLESTLARQAGAQKERK